MLRFLKTHSYKDKRVLLSHLEDKGHKKPKTWKKIHSEVCGEDELNFDVDGLLKDLAEKKGYSLDDKKKFAVTVISNPNIESRLDKGEFKVRYRYDLAFDKQGQKKIQDNTREFCEVLIRQNNIYRREDIDAMSFSGSNPIAKQNYSIFRLKGHWNCRHAWKREVYVQIRDEETVENNPIFGKKLTLSENKNKIMSKEKIKLAIASFSEKMEGQPLTKDDIILVNELLLGKQMFVDVTIDDKILRIDADEVTEGAAVNWIDEAGELMEVEDGELTLTEEGKVITVTAGVITAVADVVEEAAEGEAEETELEEDVEPTIEEKFANLEASATAKIEEAIAKLTATIEGKFSEVEKKVEEIPAFDKVEVKQDFAEQPKEGKTRVTLNTPFKRN